jgi:hypothetical protein
MTAEIINLNRVRKARERAERERQAEGNRRKFGQSKSERSLVDAQNRKFDSDLDGAQRDNDSDEDNDDIDPGAAS